MSALRSLRGLDPTRADALLAAALLRPFAARDVLTPVAEGRRPEAAGGRRPWRWRGGATPLATALVVVASVCGLAVLVEIPNAAFLLPTGVIAMYSLGAYASRGAGWSASRSRSPLCRSAPSGPEDATVTDLTAPAILFTATWALGRSMRSRRARACGSRTAPTG